MHGTLEEKEIIPSEMGRSSAPKRHRKVKSSRQGTLSQSDVSHSTGHTSGKGSRTSSKDSSSSKGSGASFDEKGNRRPETAMYPTLLGDQSLNSGQNMLPGRSWSTVLQSNPSIGNSASGGNRKDRIQKENKQMQKDEDFVAGSQRQNIFGKGSKKRLQKNTGSQIITKSKDAKPEDIGWTSLDGHPSSIWKNRQKPDAGSNTRQRIYEPYHGDLEWRVDAENARRQMTVSSESRTRNYSGMRAVRNIEGLRRQSTMITEHFRFKNVTKEFSDRAKRILFSGCVKTEKTEDEENYFNTGEQSRGWYESYVWNSNAHRHDIVKESRCPCDTGLNPKVPASDSHGKQFVCTQKSLQQQNNNKYGSIFDKTVKGSAWSTVSDASQTRHVDVAQAISGSFQKRLDTFGNEPAISHPTAEILGSDVIHRNGIVGEDSRTALVNASNDEPGQHDIQVENSDFVDEENDWVCVTAKSTIRSWKKERLIASRQKFESGGQSVLDKSKVRSPSDGNIMSRNTGIVKNEIKMKQSRSNNIRTEEDKGKQGELTVVKKEKAKKKRKKKKSKEKEKPLYDNDQQKIREFKMWEMIEENLKMNLVELTKTRQSNESEVDKDEVEEWPAIGSKGTHSAKLMSFSDALKRWKPAPEVRVAVYILSYHVLSCHIIYRTYHIISYHVMSCHVISYHIISYHIISYHIISYHIISYHIISYHIISYHIISYHINPIISYHIISYHIIYHIISYHINPIISYHISYIIYHISYIISYHIISYHIIISYQSYHIISYHIISYHIISYQSYHITSYIISHIIYHISYIIYHISYIIYHISYINHISYIICRISYIVYHISYIIYHISYIIYHISCQATQHYIVPSISHILGSQEKH